MQDDEGRTLPESVAALTAGRAWGTDVRPGTVETYKVAFDKLAAFVGFCYLPAVDVSCEHVEAWRDYMSAVEGLKPQSANQKLRHVGVFFNWLVREGVLHESPFLAGAVCAGTSGRCVERAERAHPRGGPCAYRCRPPARRARRTFTFRAVTRRGIAHVHGRHGLPFYGVCRRASRQPESPGAASAWYTPAITKGRYDRVVAFGFLDGTVTRPLRSRNQETHEQAYLAQLWLGRNGALSYAGVYELVKSAATAAGLVGVLRIYCGTRGRTT